jgi:hypothetical protein
MQDHQGHRRLFGGRDVARGRGRRPFRVNGADALQPSQVPLARART